MAYYNKFPSLLVGGLSPVELNYESNASSGANLATYTFAGQGIGTANADRRIIVAVFVHRNAATSIVSVTVGGQSCTELVSISNPTLHRTALWITDAPVTSGTTADVVVTPNAFSNSCGIGVWSATGIQSITPTATYSNNSTDGSMTVVVPAGGIFVTASVNGNTDDMTWTNATEDTELTVGDVSFRLGLASTDTSATVTRAVTTSAGAMTVGASLR